MSLQPLFRRFHEAIQLRNLEENRELRGNRDRILKWLREGLKPRTFEQFNQGSYAMGTGIKPLNGDYDIDVGIVLNDVYHNDHEPVEVKRWVFEALRQYTEDVDWQRPCITVNHRDNGELKYHVDLAVFARERGWPQLWLAMGEERRAPDRREWQPDDRKGFIEDMKTRFSGEDGAQFCRVIRYLKRWKDVHFPTTGHAAPTGLALTVVGYSWFRPTSDGNGRHDDLSAIASLVTSLLPQFRPVPYVDDGARRLRLSLPRAPYDDVFEGMNNQQMQEFRQRLQKLAGWLTEAQQTGSSEPLVKAFGKDFPAE